MEDNEVILILTTPSFYSLLSCLFHALCFHYWALASQPSRTLYIYFFIFKGKYHFNIIPPPINILNYKEPLTLKIRLDALVDIQADR